MRLSDEGLFLIPPVKQARLVGVRERAFSVRAPSFGFPPQGCPLCLKFIIFLKTFKSGLSLFRCFGGGGQVRSFNDADVYLVFCVFLLFVSGLAR